MAKRGSKAPNYNDSTLSGRTQPATSPHRTGACQRTGEPGQASPHGQRQRIRGVRTSTRRSRLTSSRPANRGSWGFRYNAVR